MIMNMEVFQIKNNINKIILAMGPESDGNFCILKKSQLYYFSGYDDLLDEDNYVNYKNELLEFIKNNNLVPDVILIDLHPLFKTSLLGCDLAKKYNAKLIKVQHHHAHIGSAVLDKIISDDNYKIKNFGAITSDGTGYGLDCNVWGGEVFKYEVGSMKYERIGSLEDQILIGSDLAIKEPARMMLSILLKLNKSRELVNSMVVDYYCEKELNILIKQYKQKFNCQTTTSTGRVLDAVSVLLGFCDNKRDYKHQPIDFLEKNSGEPYKLEPKIEFDKIQDRDIISTSYLFEYLIDNLDKDKQRLAATAQLYLAQGFFQVMQKQGLSDIYFAGGMANNKIMSEYFQSLGVYLNKKIPCGDKGISLGQIGSYILTNPGD